MKIFGRRLTPKALQFSKDDCWWSANLVRKLLQNKFGSHLFRKDLICLKQTLAVVNLTGATRDEILGLQSKIAVIQRRLDNKETTANLKICAFIKSLTKLTREFTHN